VYPLNTCSEFLSRSENIAVFANSANTGNPLIIERAIYNWIYDDASSGWGHREACLLQDKDLATSNSLYGFKDNYGPVGTEGFIGIATAGATDGSYAYFPATFLSQDVVVLKIMDPVAAGTATTNSCAYNLTTLPVSLVSFRAVADPALRQVQLHWETAQELNNRQFTVERSRDLATVSEVGYVPASGNTTTRRTYALTDYEPLPGLSYYRLRQTDLDGITTITRWQALTYLPDAFAVVYPNPSAGHELTVQLLSAEPAQVRVADLLGRPVVVRQSQLGTLLSLYPSAPLWPGLYMLHVEQNGAAVSRAFW
jgi:hypothetical protein